MKQRLDELGEPGDPTQQLRLVVPNSTIGMVIGKGGETVEQMKQRSGANILISKKDEVKIPERVITLVGEVRSNQVALDMILEKVGLPSFLWTYLTNFKTLRLWKIQIHRVAWTPAMRGLRELLEVSQATLLQELLSLMLQGKSWKLTGHFWLRKREECKVATLHDLDAVLTTETIPIQ